MTCCKNIETFIISIWILPPIGQLPTCAGDIGRILTSIHKKREGIFRFLQPKKTRNILKSDLKDIFSLNSNDDVSENIASSQLLALVGKDKFLQKFPKIFRLDRRLRRRNLQDKFLWCEIIATTQRNNYNDNTTERTRQVLPASQDVPVSCVTCAMGVGGRMNKVLAEDKSMITNCPNNFFVREFC